MYVWHASFMNNFDLRHANVWYDSRANEIPLICVTWQIYKCDMTHSHLWHDSIKHVYVSFFVICMCDVPHLWICVTWLILMYVRAHLYMRPGSFVNMCDMTHSVMWLIQMCDVTCSFSWAGEWNLCRFWKKKIGENPFCSVGDENIGILVNKLVQFPKSQFYSHCMK